MDNCRVDHQRMDRRPSNNFRTGNCKTNTRNNACRRNICASHTETKTIEMNNSCQMPSNPCASPDQIHWGDLPIGMAYVPSQKLCRLYSPSQGLNNGTIFQNLCKPFCGKGGGCH